MVDDKHEANATVDDTSPPGDPSIPSPFRQTLIDAANDENQQAVKSQLTRQTRTYSYHCPKFKMYFDAQAVTGL